MALYLMPNASEASPVARHLNAIHERFRSLADGTVATYIPELAGADPAWFGLSVATADGHVYEMGETRQPFTIQSISKPFVYGLVLEDRGKSAVLDRVGVEPTGEAFNEISLESTTGRPRNPMINAGAITATSLVAGDSPDERWARILALFSSYAGRGLALNERVYQSERDTGHRNRAISHMLRNFGIIERDPEPDLDLYFRQCSIEVDCRDLSIMGATLATGGINPVTRERVLQPDNVDEVLSVMTTCGMYDYAGEWVYRVGLPAKSGVSGGIVAVMPGQLAISAFSPPLDERGNSVRGVAAFEALSNELGLHFLRAPRTSVAAVRSRTTVGACGSKRARFDAERDLLAAHGHEAVLYQLQGELAFASAEVVIRRLCAESVKVSHLSLDFTRVSDIDRPAEQMFLELFATLRRRGRQLAFVGLARHPRMLRELEETRVNDTSLRIPLFDDQDLAAEWCEDALLSKYGAVTRESGELPLANHAILRNLSPAQVEQLASRMERRCFRPREFLVRKGDAGDELFLLVDGGLSVLADTPEGRLHRLAALCPGMAFGEPAMVAGAARSAYVRADVASTCWVLDRATFASLGAADPDLAMMLFENLLLSATSTLTRFSEDVLAERS